MSSQREVLPPSTCTSDPEGMHNLPLADTFIRLTIDESHQICVQKVKIGLTHALDI